MTKYWPSGSCEFLEIVHTFILLKGRDPIEAKKITT